MTLPIDPVANLSALICCPSVTPEEGGAMGVLQAMLEPIGFSVDRPVFSDADTPDVENLYARLGDGGPHLMFAGHTDVVPPGMQPPGPTLLFQPRSRKAGSMAAARST